MTSAVCKRQTTSGGQISGANGPPRYETCYLWSSAGTRAMSDTVTPQEDRSVRIAALADLHFGRHPAETYAPILSRAAADADVLLICGDLTDHGRAEEAQGLCKALPTG